MTLSSILEIFPLEKFIVRHKGQLIVANKKPNSAILKKSHITRRIFLAVEVLCPCNFDECKPHRTDKYPKEFAKG